MIPFTFITLAVAGAGAYMLSRVLRNFQPGNKKIMADLADIQSDMDKWAGELVPLTNEEIELFSFRQTNQSSKRGMTPTAHGVYTTIYHEPVLAYSYKQYAGKGRHALLYVRTAEHDYSYWMRPGGVQVVIDDQLVGTLKENGILYDAKKQRPLARINRGADELMPILIRDREVGSLVRPTPEAAKEASPRAFQFVKSDLNPEERSLLIALAAYELGHPAIEKK